MLANLKKVYLSHYIDNKIFDSTIEVMDFLYYMITRDELDFDKNLEYTRRKFGESLMEKFEKDMIGIEKSTIYLQYPINFMMKKNDIIYSTINDKEFEEVFGFTKDSVKRFLDVITIRVNIYNNRFKSFIENELSVFNEDKFVGKFYFTKEELMEVFDFKEKEIDNLLKLFSIDISSISEKEDVKKIINYSEKYMTFFITDFLYKTFNILEQKIIEYYKSKNNEQKYYENRGKTFEKRCYETVYETFKEDMVYKNVIYIDEQKNNHEIDAMVVTRNECIVFECKSSMFDVYSYSETKEMVRRFKNGFSNGYKTVEDFQRNILDGKGKFKDITIDIKGKKVVYIMLTLNNIEFLQTKINKIDENILKTATIYPIVWNYIDFLTFCDLASFRMDKILEYINKRYNQLNNKKNIELDVDEVDVMGFITDEKYKGFDMIEQANTDIIMSIDNSYYRNIISQGYNKKWFEFKEKSLLKK